MNDTEGFSQSEQPYGNTQADLPLLPGDRVFFKYNERYTYPAFIQGFNSDGSARLWVMSVMSCYRQDCTEGTNLGQYSREYVEPQTNLKELPEFR
jgi:hypothetical protein